MQIRRSLWITFAFSNATTVVMFVVSLILARVLTPHEIGVFSVCFAVTTFCSVFRDLGAATYLIRKETVDNEDVGSVLGLTLTSSVLIATVLWLLRHRLAAFFGEPSFADVLPILLFNFMLIPVAAAMTALLVRNLSAGRSALVGGVSTLAYAAVVLSLAVNGFGSQAQAWANTANLLSTILLLVLVMPKTFRLRPRWRGWGGQMQFARGMVFAQLAAAANNALPDAVLGRTLGAHFVGMFSRANGTVSLFHQAFGPTVAYNALPIIARTYHPGAAAVATLLARSASFLTALAWPIYIWLAVFPAEVIGLLYGKAWLDAAPLVPWLCLAAAARAPFLTVEPALNAINRPFSAAKGMAAGLFCRVLLLGALGFADLHRFVMLLCVADVVANLAWALAARKHLGLGAAALRVCLRGSVLLAAACAAVALATRWALDGRGLAPGWSVLISGAAVLVTWLIVLFAVRHPFADELRNAWQRMRGALAPAAG